MERQLLMPFTQFGVGFLGLRQYSLTRLEDMYLGMPPGE